MGFAGMGIPETAGIGGIYSRKDGLWVENDGISIKIYDAFGELEKNSPIITGVPTSDGSYFLQTKKIGEITVSFVQSVMNKIINHGEIYFQIPVFSITIQEADKNGNIYIGVQLLEERIGPDGSNGPPYSIDDNYEVIVVMDRQGKEKQRIYMPVSTSGLSINRSIRVTTEGIIYQLVLDDKEAVMWRYKS